jgi:hypothetical protein
MGYKGGKRPLLRENGEGEAKGGAFFFCAFAPDFTVMI